MTVKHPDSILTALRFVITKLPRAYRTVPEVRQLQDYLGDETNFAANLQGAHWAVKHATERCYAVEIRGDGDYLSTRDEVLKWFDLTPHKLAMGLSKGGGRYHLTHGDQIITITRKRG